MLIIKPVGTQGSLVTGWFCVPVMVPTVPGQRSVQELLRVTIRHMAETGRYTSAPCTMVPSYTLQDDQGDHSASFKSAIQSPFPNTCTPGWTLDSQRPEGKSGRQKLLGTTGLLGAQSQNSNP